MRTTKMLTLEEAQDIVGAILKQAKTDGGDPVAIAVVGADAQLIAFAAMNGVESMCIRLAINKAHTSVRGGRDTVIWEARQSEGLDGRNFTDPRFTCFGGGVVLEFDDVVVGGIGVSGRKSSRRNLSEDAPPQDHELAREGLKVFADIAAAEETPEVDFRPGGPGSFLGKA